MPDYSYYSRVALPARNLPLATGVDNLAVPRLNPVKAVEVKALLTAMVSSDAFLRTCAGENLPAGLAPDQILPFFYHRAAAAIAAERKIGARVIATDPNSDVAFVARQRRAFYAAHREFVVENSGSNHTAKNYPVMGTGEEAFVRQVLNNLRTELTSAFTSSRAVATICAWLVARFDATERLASPGYFGLANRFDPLHAARVPFREQLKFLSPTMLIKFPHACRYMFQGDAFEPMARVAMVGIATLLRGVPCALRTTAIPGRTLLEDIDPLVMFCNKRAFSGQGMYELNTAFLHLTRLWADYRACQRHLDHFGQTERRTAGPVARGAVATFPWPVQAHPEFSLRNLRIPLSLLADKTIALAALPPMGTKSLAVRDSALPIALVTERAVDHFEGNGHFQFPDVSDQASVEPFVRMRAASAVRAERRALKALDAISATNGPLTEFLSERRAVVTKYDIIDRLFGGEVTEPESLPLMTEDVEVFVLREMRERREELRHGLANSPAARVVLARLRKTLEDLAPLEKEHGDLSESQDPTLRLLGNLKNYGGEYKNVTFADVQSNPKAAIVLLFDQLFAQSSKVVLIKLKEICDTIPKLLADVKNADATATKARARLMAIEMEYGQSPIKLFCELQHMIVLYQDYTTCRQYTSHTNSRLIRSVAKKFLYSGMEYDDLLGHARHGFFKGIDRHSEAGKGKISTYVTRWMQQVLFYVTWVERFQVHIPVHLKNLSARIDELLSKAELKNERQPSPEELAEKTGRPLEEVQKLLKARQTFVDVDRPLGDGDGTTMGDAVLHTDPDADPNETVDRLALIEKALDEVMDEREAEIIRWYFGFKDGVPRTLKQIAAMYGITRERVRQIKSEGMTKLCESSYYSKLEVFIPKFRLHELASDEADTEDANAA